MSSEKILPIAEIAKVMFAKASGKYSASSTAQAAFIALECQRQRLSPKELGTILASDFPRILELVSMARSSHGKLPANSQPIVDPKRLIQILNYDFLLAEKIQYFSEETLTSILTEMYEECVLPYKSEPESVKAYQEDVYEDKVLEMFERDWRAKLREKLASVGIRR
jgi:hypothetical protein